MKKHIKEIYFEYRCFILRLKMMIFSLGKPLEKKIVFDSFNGKQYSDNPRAISEFIHKNYPEYKIVWKIFKEQAYDIIPSYVQVVHDEKCFLRELSSAFCYVRNIQFMMPFRKRKKQLFIQTWHGDRRFKEILREKPGFENMRIYDNKLVDIAMSSGRYGDESYRLAFGYKGKLISVGQPRTELMLSYDEGQIQIIKNLIGIPIDCKVLLYAPTFRDNEENEQDVCVDIEEVLTELEKDGENWMCLLRAHPSSPGLKPFKGNHINVDVSNYPDMADMLAISDMLITDYSSSVCDFALMNKPVLMAAYDIDEYQKKYRGFKVNPETAGFFVARSQGELISLLKKKSKNDYIEAYKKVNDFFGTNETGKSTETICAFIDEWYKTNVSK